MTLSPAEKICYQHSGNRCGHDPLRPRWYLPPEKHKSRPIPLVWASQLIPTYYKDAKNTEILSSLKRVRRAKTKRQERTEARERNGSFIQCILHYLELATMRVGIPYENGRFASFTLKNFAYFLGWRTREDEESDAQLIEEGKKPKLKGLKRAWRALQVLKEAGYIAVYKRFEKTFDAESAYKGLPAVKRVEKKLFYELGISHDLLEKEAKKAGKRLKKRYKDFINAASKNGVHALADAMSQLNNNLFKFKGFKKFTKYRTKTNQEQQQKDTILAAIDMQSTYPSLSLTDCYKKIIAEKLSNTS